MSNLSTFVFDSFPVRVAKVEDGNPWFVAKDIAEILEYENSRTMTRRLDDDEKGVQVLHTPGGDQEMTVINESGLYSAILGSSKPEAKRFKKWITSEVIPSIRAKGGYLATSATDTPETIMARAVLIAADTIERQKRELSEAKEQLAAAAPKVAFVETFACSKGNILVRDYAKHIAQALGLRGFGQDKMFTWLRENNYMNINRYPTQRAIDSGFLHVTEGMHCHHDGSTGLHHCTRITPKGQAHFFGKIRAQVMAGSEAQNG